MQNKRPTRARCFYRYPVKSMSGSLLYDQSVDINCRHCVIRSRRTPSSEFSGPQVTQLGLNP